MARYWVGGSGNINDTAHWSTSSGGAGGASIPDGTLRSPVSGGNLANDDVYFDANSFGADGAVVTMNAALMPKSLDMSGVTHTFSFSGSGSVVVQGATFTLSNKFTGNAGTWSVIPLSNAARTINQAGADMSAVTSFTMTGGGQTTGGNTFNLSSDINMPSASFGCSSSFWTSALTTFNSNNYNITCYTFFMTGSAPDPFTICSITANLGTSTINCSAFTYSTFQFIGYSTTINGTNATTNITPVGSPSNSNILDAVSGNIGNVHFFKGTGSSKINDFNGHSYGAITIDPGASVTFPWGVTSTVTNFTANGDMSNQITFVGGSNGAGTLNITGSSSVSYITVSSSIATGAGAPIYATNGGINNGGNSNWFFTIVWPNPAVIENITVSESDINSFTMLVWPPAANQFLYQDGIHMINGQTYNFSFDVSNANGYGILVYMGANFLISFASNGTQTTSFVWPDATGDYRLSFNLPSPNLPYFIGTIDNVSLKQLLRGAVADNVPIKEFLTGNTDEGQPIFFRADTQLTQLNQQFETFSTPLAIVTRLQRGTLVKCFVSIDNGEFYEIQGTASKGVSILKVNSKNRSTLPTPPLARKIQISWRDGSMQLCRLIQSAIVFIPGTMDYSE